MNIEDKEFINWLEKIGGEVHPALEKIEYDGWLLNFAEGYTRRANSILAFESGKIELGEKICKCEQFYKERDLPCIFKMTEASAEGLQNALEKNGYTNEAPTDVMIVDSDSPDFVEVCEGVVEPEELGVTITSNPDEAWLNAFFEFENRNDADTIRIATNQFCILDNNDELDKVYCRLQILGQDVAVASAVIKDGILFLLNVVVKESCRGRGYGKLLVKETLEAAVMIGAEKLCLQVMKDNQVAVKLYESFGFRFLYKYWYMVKRENI